MGKKRTLYSTTDNDEELKYLSDQYKSKRDEGDIDEEEPKIYQHSTTLGNPKKGIVAVSGRSNFSMSADQWDRYAEGFAGGSQEELDKYRQDTQSFRSKALNTFIGGALSGIGTFIEDVGYLTDMNTYAAIFGDIDHNINKSLSLYQLPNWGSTILQKFGTGVKNWTNNSMPAYEYKDGSIADEVFSWGALKSTIDSAVGFTLTGLGAGSLLKKGFKELIPVLAKAGKYTEAALVAREATYLPKVISKVEGLANKTARLEQYVKFIDTKFPQLGSQLGSLGTATLTNLAEARMEGLDTYETVKSQLQPFVADGTISPEEADMRANDAANHSFDMTRWMILSDYIATRSLFSGPAKSAQKLLKPGLKTNLLKAGNLLKNAPAEGFEEMWQETAKMEGSYNTFKAVKDKLDEDEQVKLIQRMGFDPNELPSNFLVRTAALMTSQQSQVAGWIGAISGPLQAGGMGLMGRKERAEKEREAYDAQQAVYSENKNFINATDAFVKNIKEIAISESMQDIAALTGEKEMTEIATEIALKGIALKNFANGTTDNLREEINANKEVGGESLSRKLDEMENSYRKAKRYTNPEEVFSLQENIRINKKLADLYTRKANDTKLSEKERKAYVKAAENVTDHIQGWETELNKVTSTKHQLDLIESIQKAEKLAEVHANLEDMRSLTELEKLSKEYPGDELIKERIDSLHKIGNDSKKSDKRKITVEGPTNKTVNKEVKEGEVYTHKGKTVHVDKVNKNDKGKVKTVTVTDTNNVTSDVESEVEDFVPGELTQEELNKGRVLENGIKKTAKGVTVLYNTDELTNGVNGILAKAFQDGNAETGKDIQPNKSHIQSLKDTYYNDIDDLGDDKEVSQMLYNKAKELYKNTYDNLRTEEDTEEVEVPVKEKPITQLQAAKDLADILNADYLVNQNPSIEEDVRDIRKDKIAKLQALNNFLNSLEDQGLDSTDFKVVIKELAETPTFGIETVKLHYKALRFLFTEGYESNLPATYEELMGITVNDFIDVQDMPTLDKNKKILEALNNRLDPKKDEIEQFGIYTQEKVISTDSKNTLPASSFAYLSQEYNWLIEQYDENGIKVGRETSDKTVQGNPLLNPNKCNEGDTINFKLDTEYSGPITLSTGERVEWETMKNSDWDEFKVQHKLAVDEELVDYTPITINTEVDGTVAYIHNVTWINKLNTVEDEDFISNAKDILRNFRKSLLEQFIANDNSPIQSVIIEKAIDITKEGSPKGFTLNRKLRDIASKNLPAKDLNIGMLKFGSVKVLHNQAIEDNVLNAPFLTDDYNDGTVFIFTPLGKKKGKMTYWAHPLMSNKVTKQQSRTLRQAIEIYISQDESLYPELYNNYLTGTDKIDFKKAADLSKLLKKVIYLYSGKNKLKIEDFVKSKVNVGNPTAVVQFEKDTLTFGRSMIKSFKKGDYVDPKMLDIIENDILGNMLFNISEKGLNNPEINFNFVQVEDDNTLSTFDGSYNDFVKNNTTTMAGSTKLDDGEYGYVIQPIVRFDMTTTVSLKLPLSDISDTEYNQFIDKGIVTKSRLESIANKVEVGEKLTDREMAIFTNKTGDINKLLVEKSNSNKELEKAASILNTTVENLIETMKATNMTIEQILEISGTANRLEKNSNEFDC